MNEFEYIQKAFKEESQVQKKCITKEVLGYEPSYSMVICSHKVKEDYIQLQFWGWELVLEKDGTYYISDTSGG